MTTKLDSPLTREIKVEGRPYTVTLMPEAVKVTAKGKRKDVELSWKDLLSGDKALGVALNASLSNLPPTQIDQNRSQGKPKAKARCTGRK